jgi:hypothetical protein
MALFASWQCRADEKKSFLRISFGPIISANQLLSRGLQAVKLREISFAKAADIVRIRFLGRQ